MGSKRIGGGKMNIGVDAGCLGIKDKRLQLGVYQVGLNLLRELGKLDKNNEYFLYSFFPIEKKLMRQFGLKMKNVVVKPIFGWNYLALPLSLTFKKPDVFLGISQSLPFFCPFPTVVIVYDLAFEHFPDFYPKSHLKLKKITRSAVQKAKRVIAISQSTRNDLKKLYDVSFDKVKVIYGGYNKSIFKTKGKVTRKNYFLFVGALKRIKNVPRLLEGFKYFLEKSKLEFQLVLVGSDFWLDPEIEKTIKKLKLRNHVEIKGFLPRNKLPRLYQEAMAFISPSFYEGFGIPLLEATGCECPVIAGKNGAAKEIIGKAGILIDPWDDKAIGKAMLRLAGDKILRQKVIKKGLKQTEMFSWEKFAQGVLKVIKESVK